MTRRAPDPVRSAPARKAAARPAAARLFAAQPMTTKVGYLIRRLHQMHLALFVEETGAIDITPVQFTVLSLLCQRGEIEQSELAVEVGMDRTNVSEVVRRLQARGYLDVRVHPSHGRRRLLTLLPAGLALVKQVDPGAQRAHQRIVGTLQAGDQQVFLDLLRQVISHDGGPPPPPSPAG